MTTLYNFFDRKQLNPCGEITKRSRLFTGYLCNINCKFCFYKDQKHVDIKDKIWQQLEQGKLYGIRDWDISGGEPSILPYWFEIIDKAKSMGFRNIACITNGYRFSDNDFLKKSIDFGLNELLFSIHGSNEEIHDKMTGVKESFRKIQLAISNAVRNKLTIRINVVVNKDNYKDLKNIASYINSLEEVAAFNFLPFREENSANGKDNCVKYSIIAPYIQETIDILNSRIKKRIRYVPFCLFLGYEKYVAGYLQRIFDEYEWSEYTIREFEAARYNKNIQPLDCHSDRWKLEINALNESIKHAAGHSIKCLRCKYLKVCDGVWKTYANAWGIEELTPMTGKITNRILQD